MKQDLWLVNSSLVLMFASIMGMYNVLDQEIPAWKTPHLSTSQDTEKKKDEPVVTPAWEKIYQDDIFGTFIQEEQRATKQSFVTPIPEPKQPVIPPPPEIKKQEFITPLNITLRGIIAGSDEDKNVAMLADETNKEEMYHLGEKVKDAQIVKIAHNRVIVLRANGQQETFYLRKDDVPLDDKPEEKWKYIIKKNDDQHFTVDPESFTKEVDTLGNLIDRASIVGTAFQGGKPMGLRVGAINAKDVGAALGLMENDIITAVNDLDVGDANNRIKAYETISQLQPGGEVKVTLKRTDKDISLSYKLAKIDKPRKSMFPGVRYADAKPSPEETMKMSRLQQREQTVRDFHRQHVDTNKHQQTIAEIRRRILENLQNRQMQHARR